MNATLNRFFKDESGATAIEYGLIAALVAVICITGLTTLGTKLTDLFSGVAGKLVAPT
jgi:pilus assembly protein Flp/PilA